VDLLDFSRRFYYTRCLMQVDFGKTAADYASHRAGFPEVLFLRVQRMGIGLSGQSLLDLGTGTGALARQFSRQGCGVVGVDLSGPLLEEARRLARQDGLEIEWVQGPAESTGLSSASFDVVSAGQCWHWFEREKVAAEVYRLLRPNGSLLIAHFDWLSRPGNIVEESVKLALLQRETPPPAQLSVGIRGTYSLWLEEVEAVGFTEVETFSFDVEVPYSPVAWRGRMRASALLGATISKEKVEAFDRALTALLIQQCVETLLVPHRVFALTAKKGART
jgi:SAM-dependent methyltransferase